MYYTLEFDVASNPGFPFQILSCSFGKNFSKTKSEMESQGSRLMVIKLCPLTQSTCLTSGGVFVDSQVARGAEKC